MGCPVLFRALHFGERCQSLTELEIIFGYVPITNQQSWADFAAQTGVPEPILRHLNPNITEFFMGLPIQIPTLNVSAQTRVEWLIEGGQVKAYDTTPQSGVLAPIPAPGILRAVPSSYMLPSEDELLRWMWEHEFGENPDQYDAKLASERFEQFIAEAVAEKVSWVQRGWTSGSWQFSDQGSESDQQIADLLDFNLFDARGMNDYLAQLSLDELITLYNQLPSSARTELVPFQEATYDEFVDYYLSLLSSYQDEADESLTEEGQTPEADLALLDFYQHHFGTTDLEIIKQRLFDQAVNMFLARQLHVEDLGIPFRMPMNSADRAAYADEIENAVRARLRPEGTVAEYIAQIAEWTASAYGDTPIGDIIPELGRYYEALALDDLRAFAYGDSEVDDVARLTELEDAILTLPRAIFDVDVSFVQDALLKYVNDLKQIRDLRVQLRAQLASVELNLTGQEARPFLTWVDELLLSLISDIFDVIFSLREILRGNWLGLLGLLPFIPSAIAHLGYAVRYAVNVSDEVLDRIRRLGGRIDDLGEITPYFPGSGARNVFDFPDVFDDDWYLKGLPLYDEITERNVESMIAAIAARYPNVPEEVLSEVYEHIFMRRHWYSNDDILKDIGNGGFYGYFMPDPQIGLLWLRAVGDEQLARDLLGEQLSRLGASDLDFNRLLAHEYIEARLEGLGYVVRYNDVLDTGAMRASAHNLAPLTDPLRFPFRHYRQLNLSENEIETIFAQWVSPVIDISSNSIQNWMFQFVNLDELINTIISIIYE